MIRVADYVARFLLERGVNEIFMLTGNGAMYLNDAIAQSGLRFICARNEAAAPMMAEAYARIKQSLGAVCLTSGPGSTNAVPGLAEAWVDAAPVMIISGQVQRNHTTRLARVPGLRTLGTAEVDIIPIVSSLTKYAVMIDDPSTIRFHLEKAAHLALSGRPGPVWIDVPMDVQYALIEPDQLEGFSPEVQGPGGPSIESQATKFAELFSSANRPLVVAGHGVRQGHAVEELMAFLERFQIPVITSRFGQDLMPYSHPLNMGQAGLKGTKYCPKIMSSADLILALGCRLSVQLVGHRFDAFAENAKVVMVDIDPAELAKPGVRIDLPILADVKHFLTAVLNRPVRSSPANTSPWLQSCQKLKSGNPMVTSDQQRNPIDLYYFMSRLDAASSGRHIMTTDAGSNYYVGGQVYQFERGQREVTSGTFAAMGLSIPLAIGASVARPDAQVLAVTGDGSLELNIQELKTMSHYGLDIKLFVINNGGYVSMRNWQDGYFEGRRIDTAENTGAGTLNFRNVARAFDLDYEVIDRHENIDPILKRITSKNGPLLVEVVCDSNQKIISPFTDYSYKVAPSGADRTVNANIR